MELEVAERNKGGHDEKALKLAQRAIERLRRVLGGEKNGDRELIQERL